MNQKYFQTHFFNERERLFGTCWLVFQTLFFSTVLQLLNLLLPKPLPQITVNFIYFCVNFAVTVLIFRTYLLGQIRLIPEVIDKVLCLVIIGFAAYMATNFLLMQILFAMDAGFTSVNDVTVQYLVSEDYAVMFFSTVFLAPITEETLFRGLLFRGLHDRSPVLAWIMSVTLFSLVHILGYIGAYPFHTLLLCFVQYLPAGIVLATAYRLSGSLLAPILIHALVNFFGMMALR